MITLTTDGKAFGDLERLIDKISNPGSGNTRKIADGIRQQFQANFTRQGSGAGRWAPLRPFTIRERAAKGYGAGPILVRSGRYRASFVQRGGDHYERVQQSGDGTTYEVGSNDSRGPELEFGRANMAARPVTILDDGQEAQLTRLVDFVVEQTERQFWR